MVLLCLSVIDQGLPKGHKLPMSVRRAAPETQSGSLRRHKCHSQHRGTGAGVMKGARGLWEENHWCPTQRG